MISNMSQTSNTSDQNKSDKRRKRATIATVYASTPIKQNAVSKQFHLSLSTISSSSSSEAQHMRAFFNKDHLKQINKTLSKEKKGIHTKRITKDSDSEWRTKQKELTNKSLNEKRKRKLKNKRKTVKWKQVAQVEDTDNEWETRSEKSINELSTGSRGSILTDNECINLFDNPCTPEKTRDVSNMYNTNLHESPIIEFSRRRLNLTSKRNDIMQDKLLPVNLLPMEVPENSNEDEIIIHNENNAEIHISSRTSEESQEQLEDSFMQSPTYRQCRDQYTKTYLGKRSRLELTTSFEQIKLPEVPRKQKSPIPPGMRCITEYWDKALQKWVRKRYENSSTDSEYWDNDLQKWVPRRHKDSSPEKDFENDKRKRKTRKRNTEKQKWKLSRFTLKQRYNVHDTSKDRFFQEDLKNGKHKTKISERNAKRQKRKPMFQSTQKQRYNVYDAASETDVEFET